MSLKRFISAAAFTCAFAWAVFTLAPGAADDAASGKPEPAGDTATAVPTPAKSADGAFNFPFDEDKDFNGQPDLWVRVFDKDNPARVPSRIEQMKGGVGGSVVFRLNHGGALLESRQYLEVDWRLTYSLESWIMPAGMSKSTACAEARFFDKDLKPLDEFTVRTTPVGGTSQTFIERAAVVENLGKRVKYAKIYCVLSGVFEEFDSKEKPAYAAFNAVLLKEFPRSVISGDAIYFVGDCASVTITTSSLKPGKYQTEQEFLDYRLVNDYIKNPMIVDEHTQEGFYPHVFTGTPRTLRPGYFIFRFSIKSKEDGRVVSRSSTPYVVLERRSPFQSAEFGAGADFNMKPKRLETFLSHLGLGYIQIDFPLDNSGFAALRKLFDYTLPGVEKNGEITLPEEATLSDDKAREELKRAAVESRKIAREFSDEVSSFIIRLTDPEILSRKAAGWAMSDVMKPIRETKGASRMGFAPGAADSLPLPQGFNFRVLDVPAETLGKNIVSKPKDVEIVSVVLPEYDKKFHYEQMMKLARTVIELKRAGFGKICVQKLSDDRCGLIGSSGEMRPGFIVYRTLAYLLTEAKAISIKDPATGAPFTILPGAETVFFETPRGRVLAAWTDGEPQNAAFYLGSDLVLYNLLEGSGPPDFVDGKAVVPLSGMPVFLSNVNLDLIKFYLDIKFETERVLCRLKPQKLTFSFKNHFSETVDAAFSVAFPAQWTADRTMFNFERVQPGESRNASVTVSIPQQTTADAKMIDFDVNVYEAGASPLAPRATLYTVIASRPLRIWSDITADVSWQAKTNALRIKVQNNVKTPITLDVYSKLEGQPTGLDSVSLPENGARDIFLPITAQNPVGKVLHLGFREQGGDRFYNLDFTIPSPEGENAGGN
jgi:hypothetical protein